MSITSERKERERVALLESRNVGRIVAALEETGINTSDLNIYYGHIPITGWHALEWGKSSLYAQYMGPNIDRVLHNIKVGYMDKLK